VEHSVPIVDEALPQSSWRLSPEGRVLATALANRLKVFTTATIWSSPELKALETAELIGTAMKLQILQEPRLQEHNRSSMGYISKAELETGVERLLASDEELVFGDETARSVFDRMAAVEQSAMACRRDVISVSHGTAIASLLDVAAALIPSHSGDH